MCMAEKNAIHKNLYGIVFSSIKTSPFEIEILIRKLESDDLKKAMKAYKILKKKFKGK